MRSPFPGMDPYLEAKWPEVHARLIVYASNQINGQLPEDLQANIEENLSVRLDDDSRAIRPDVNISEDSNSIEFTPAASTATVAEPLVVHRVGQPARHVEIVSRDGRVITAIEFLSPWNKVGSRAREQYVRKQLDYIDSGTNLVEIDLVRQGSYVLAASLDQIPPTGRTPYMVCVYRDEIPDQFEIYRVPLGESLPNIPIPLRRGEADVVLQLQPLLDACYHDGRYHRINYQEGPQVTFNDDDSKWIDARLKEQGRRD